MHKHIAVRDLSKVHPEILKAFGTTLNTFFVFDHSTADLAIESSILPFELATVQPCLCLDFDSFWALRLTKNNNRWLLWDKEFQFPEYLNKSAILALLRVCPPITFDPTIKEIMGVPVENMA